MEQSGSRIPDAWFLILAFSLMVALYFIKIEIRTKKVLFLPKNFDFLQRNADISKINRVFVPNVMKLHMCVYLRTKFQVSSIILTSFRQEVILTPPIAKRNPHKNGIKARRKEIKVYIMQGMELRLWWHLTLLHFFLAFSNKLKRPLTSSKSNVTFE